MVLKAQLVKTNAYKLTS